MYVYMYVHKVNIIVIRSISEFDRNDMLYWRRSRTGRIVSGLGLLAMVLENPALIPVKFR